MALAEPDRSRRTVLIADDDAALRETLADILDEYNVLQVGDGEEALRQVLRQPVDVLILDLAMPKRDGVSVLQALGSPPPKVILLSAFSDYRREDIELRGLGWKIARTLRKPCPPEKLLAAVDEAIEEFGPNGQTQLRPDLNEEAAVLREGVSLALGALLNALEANHLDEQRLMTRVISLQQLLDYGTPVTTALSSEPLADTVMLLSRIFDRSSSTSGKVRRALARAMRAEGTSIPAIAGTFGVTHQRISTILRSPTRLRNLMDAQED